MIVNTFNSIRDKAVGIKNDFVSDLSGANDSDVSETPDFARFMRKVQNDDLARSNMFLVRFVDLNTGIGNDGIISSLDPIKSTGGQPTTGFFGGDAYTWNRIKDISYNQLQSKLSPKIKSIMGATDPNMIKTIIGDGELYTGFFGEDYNVNRDLAMMVKSVTIPGVSLETQVNYNERKPFTEVRNRNIDTLRMIFYCSPDYAERIWFLTWLNSIHNQRKGTFGFYANYAKKINVVTLDRNGVKTSVIDMEGCFPTRVGEVTMSYEDNSQISIFEVEFTISNVTHAVSKGKEKAIDSIENIVRRTGVIRGALG